MADNPPIPAPVPVQQAEPKMDRIPLLGGAYSARSVIANAQRCVNLYPEINPETSQAPVPVTHYYTPGLTLRATITPPLSSPIVRGLYRTSKGNLYAVVGGSIYYISSTWTVTFMGNIPAATTPVSFSDNGTIVVMVTGAVSAGWWWNDGAVTFTAISDPNFIGSATVQFLDGYFVFALAFTSQFYLSPYYWNGTSPFDPTQIASKTGGSDPIVAVAVVRRELWLIGSLTSEVWYNTGAADFPFERQPGVFVEHGTAATYSVAAADVALFFLSQDRQGRGIVFRLNDYQTSRISTHAIEKEIQSYSTIADAIGFTYQQDGHTFYFLTFPTANRTWVYDMSTNQWHERVWTNPADSSENRHLANAMAFAYGYNVAGDWRNGRIYTMDLGVYTDNGDPIVRRRSFPHFVYGGKRISYASFTADMEVGTELSVVGTPAVSLRWSDKRGATWGTPVTLDMRFGQTDQYYRSLLIRRLGIARDRVFELYWSFAYKTALNGAWIETEQAET